VLKITFPDFNYKSLREFQSSKFPEELLSYLHDGPPSIIITSHGSADLDSLGAIMGLVELLSAKLPKKKITSALQSMNGLTKNFVQSFNITISQEIEEPDEPATAILLDCNSPQITGFEEILCSPNISLRLIIDHHAQHSNGFEFAHKYWFESNFAATSEIIVALAAQWNVSFAPTTASALLGGIMYDSQKFQRADDPLFQAVRLLLLWGADYEAVQAPFKTERDASEKLARLKAAQRTQLKVVKDGIIVLTHVSSYEASAARAMLALGADLAIVVASRSNETRTSIRARKQYLEKLGISVAEDLLDPTAAEFGGFGGGHQAAGGLNIPHKVSPPEIYQAILKRLEGSATSQKKDL
jgi:nanoRNase/pAp phosphatase (c-di-AMP/oligoRNAs hydrolase)